MAHGTPDWGQTAGVVTTYQLTDLGELAARLRSVVTHDRRGDVIWIEDFESGLKKWGTTLQGSGAKVELSSARARNGLYSAHLVAGSTPFVGADMAHRFPLPVLGPTGAEISFCLASTINNILLELAIYTGSQYMQAYLKWSDVTNVLSYLDSGGGETEIADDVDLAQSPTLFHTLKLVADPNAREYVRAILNDRSWDLSDIATVGGTNPTLAQGYLTLELTGRSGSNDEVYVDDAILTQNEPV